MKKFFTLFLAILFVFTLFTGCNKKENIKDENCISINITYKDFHSPDKRQKYVEELDTSKYQIIGEYYRNGTRSPDIYGLTLIKKAANEIYEVFQFSSKEIRQEFRAKVDGNKKVSYYESDGFYYLIVISENTTEKSTITVKEILQNDENYIVIADDDSLIMVPKNISKFITSSNGNTVYLETTAGTITKATFCITEEMQKKIQ